LRNELPIRFSYVQVGEPGQGASETYLSIVIHHIAFDGWSYDLFLQELNQFYDKGKLDPLNLQYSDYAVWQNEEIECNRLRDSSHFWHQKLKTYEVMNFITDIPRPLTFDTRGDEVRLKLGLERYGKLVHLAKTFRVSLFKILLSGYFLSLRAWTRQNELVVGTIVANRDHPQTQALIGPFINTVAIGVSVDMELSLKEFVQLVASETEQCLKHASFPFEKVVNMQDVPKNPSASPIFQTLFMLDSIKTDILPNVMCPIYGKFRHRVSLFDFSTHVEEGEDGLGVTIIYATSLFEKSTIENFGRCFQSILEQFSNSTLLKELRYLSHGEFDHLTSKWENNWFSKDMSRTVHGCFEEQARQTPTNLALIFQNAVLTYGELNGRANRVARHLAESDSASTLGPFIGLCFEKSVEMIVGILGVLKCGRAFVPMDPTYPIERIRFTLEDAKIIRVLGLSKFSSLFPAAMFLPLDAESLFEGLDAEDLEVKVSGEDLCYVIYTSGTTGNPKGCLCHHSGLINFIEGVSHWFFGSKPKEEVMLLLTNYAFDASLESIFVPLLNGQTLLIPPHDSIFDHNFADYLESKRVTRLSGCPTYLSHLLHNSTLPSLRRLVLGGEVCTPSMYEKCKGSHELILAYGVTEASVGSSYHRVKDKHDIRIAPPLKNVSYYLLSPELRPVPVGAVGELGIGGVGVCRGYLNQPDLTVLKFIPNPFQSGKETRMGVNGRIYLTGDLMRERQDGSYEFLAREDTQVKIRGFRIELSEITNAISTYPGIEFAVAMIKELSFRDNEKCLVAYYSGMLADEIKLRDYLQVRLPSHFIPSIIVHLGVIPTTAAGKVDFRALPEITLEDSGSSFIGPRTQLEISIRQIWASVLRLDEQALGIWDNFFSLGGDSILSISIASRLYSELGLGITVKDIFKFKTIGRIAHEISLQSSDTQKFIQTDISKISELELFPEHKEFVKISGKLFNEIGSSGGVEAIFPATPLQMGLVHYYLTREDGDSLYLIPTHLRYRNPVDVDLLKSSWERTINHFPALRSRFDWRGDEIALVVDKSVLLNWNYFENVSGSEIKELMTMDLLQYFDLSRSPLFRVTLFKDKLGEFTSSITIHHSICDGWSLALILKKVHWFYNFPLKSGIEQPETDTAFPEAQKYLSYQDETYWRSLASQIQDPVDLSVLADGPQALLFSQHPMTSPAKSSTLRLDGREYLALKSTCATYELTLSSALQFAFHKVLHLFGGQGEESVVGVLESGRDIPVKGIHSSVGLFLNTVPVVLNHEKCSKLKLVEGIQEFQEAFQEHLSHGQVPLAKIQAGQGRLFDALFVFQNLPSFEDGTEYELIPNGDENGSADYPMTLTAFEEKGGPTSLSIRLKYATELFTEEPIDGFLQSFHRIIQQIAFTPELEIGKMSFTLPGFHIAESVGVEMSLPDVTMIKLFRDQVSKTPDSIAIIFEKRKTTYRQLQAHIITLATALFEQGARSGNIISICLEKSELIPIAMFAVWYLGCAYVPIDPGFPIERISYILRNSGGSLFLTNSVHFTHFQVLEVVQLVLVETCLKATSAHKVKCYEGRGSDVAYIMYTSGSTGQPKGCIIPHRGLVNYVQFSTTNLGVQQTDCFACQSNFTFDMFLMPVCISLLNGIPLLLFPDNFILDLDRFLSVCNEMKVTSLVMTPSLAAHLDLSQITSLRRVELSGEPLPYSLYEKIRRESPSLAVWNPLGPTECTIVTHCYRMLKDGKVRIGRPIANSFCYVLNENFVQMPIRAVGELYIGGVGLGLGYLDPELTKLKFIQSPFETGQRLYRTGDLVRWGHDRQIEYIGRIGTQVKIKGRRIELGEIESLASSYPGVKQSVAIVQRDQIVLYYIGNVEGDLKGFLQNQLPPYMVPVLFLKVPSFPLTVSGKVNRKAFPEAEFKREGSVLARTEIEKLVVSIWTRVLEREDSKIGIDESFFETGGDSIRVIQLVSRLKDALRTHVTVKDVYATRTVRRFCEQFARHDPPVHSQVYSLNEQGQLTGPCNLLPIQNWFRTSNFASPNLFNMSILIRVNVLFDFERLVTSFQKLIDYHDAFRLRFRADGSAEYSCENQVNLRKINVQRKTEDEISQLLSVWQADFDLERGPLHSFGLIEGYEDGSSRIFICLHHVICDEVSINILTQDLEKLYHHQGDFSRKGTSYRQWAQLLQNYDEKERVYWQEILKDYASAADFFISNPSIAASFELSVEETGYLFFVAKSAGWKINHLLIQILAKTVGSLKNAKVVHLAVEGHGREEYMEGVDLSRTVGWFTSMFPIRVKVDENPGNSFHSLMDTLTETFANIPNHGVGFGCLYGYTHLPQVMFNYFGILQENLGEPGSSWRVVHEKTGNFENIEFPFAIAINSFVRGRKLVVSIRSRADQLSSSQFPKIFKDYLIHLPEVSINHDMNRFPNFEPFTKLNTQNSSRTLFIFPPGSGGYESYMNNLVPHLVDCQLVLFNNFLLYLEKEFSVELTYEELASAYIRVIQSIDPIGPYFLFGWSFGGILAFEISRQLVEAGLSVPAVGMLDSIFFTDQARTCLGEKKVKDVNDKYRPSVCQNLNETRFTLFKATEALEFKINAEDTDSEIDVKNFLNKAYKYFTSKTKANHLDANLPIQSHLTVVELENCHHQNWMHNVSHTKKIAQHLLWMFEKN